MKLKKKLPKMKNHEWRIMGSIRGGINGTHGKTHKLQCIFCKAQRTTTNLTELVIDDPRECTRRETSREILNKLLLGDTERALTNRLVDATMKIAAHKKEN